MKQLSIAVLWLLIPFAVLSQQKSEYNFKVKGQITDSLDYSSIPYATIVISKLPENVIERKVASDANGNFETSLKTSGKYMLVANSLGYNSISKPFTININQQNFDFGKLPLSQSSVELDAVSVVGEKPLVKVEADKLSYNAESDPESKTSNALDLLRKVPLISVDGEDNVQLKGTSNYKIFVNGKPSTMASNSPKEFLKNLPASSIKDIEVITSPGAKYDAEGVGGIINIITQKKATTNGYTCSLTSGTNTLGNISNGINYSANYGKLGVSVNLSNYYQNNPYLKNTTYRVSYEDPVQTYTLWDGKSKYKGFSPWGSGELSYEIDTLNLISASFNLWYAKNNQYLNNMVIISNSEQVANESYLSKRSDDFSFGAPEGNIDYQHTSKRNKEEIFTLSYKFNYNPTTMDGKADIDNILNSEASRQLSENNAHLLEHTFQADYVYPFVNNQKMEFGVKYILRDNTSLSNVLRYDYLINDFVIDSSQTNDFVYTQNIVAGYLSYNKKFAKFNLKAGMRLEDVFNNGTFTSKSYSDFEYKNLEYVPSASISYQLNESNSLRLSYNKRIQRPGIWYLNPYVFNADPKNIFFGNPNLDPERYHNFELNYNMNSKIGNLNMTFYNSFSNNAIDRVISLENGVSKSTYGNVSKIQSWGTSSYISLRLGKKVNANINGSLNYNFIQGNEQLNLSNEGWSYNISTNLTYNIIPGLRLSGNAFLFKPQVSLQTSRSNFYSMGLSLAKEFYKGKLALTLTARNIFWEELKFTMKTFNQYFYQEMEVFRPGRSFGINLRYRFGDMNTQVKKAQRGIRNDDVKQGEGNGNGGN